MVHDDTSPSLDEGIYRQVFEASADGIVVLDASGTPVLANRAARELCGADLGALLRALRVPDADLVAFQEDLAAKGQASVELRFHQGQAGPRRVAVQGRQLGGRDALFLRDVTERRSLEEELRHARRIESIGYLTASVVHDFNNVLTPILCLSSTLAGRLDGGAATLAREIRAAAERAAGLVRQVLMFARRTPSRPALVNLNDVIAETRALVEHVAGEEVSLFVSLDPALGDTLVDREQLEQVLLNLAANARDAMPRGGRLTVATANAVLGEDAAAALGCPSGSYVALSVADTGVGMTPQVRGRLFERFFTTKEPGAGTGLGLLSAHRFVTGSGGGISVWSEPGRGTSIVAYLPVAPADARVTPPPVSSEEPLGGTGTILVVDDDAAVRRVARAVLEERGYDVLEAASGALALEEVDRHHRLVDLLLVDVVMPRMSGRALVDELERGRYPVKVLFMSGHDDQVVEAHGVRVGRDPLLRKAFTPHELVTKVREALEAPSRASRAG